MNFFAVYLESQRYIVVKKEWVQNAVVGKPSKIFFSSKPHVTPAFNLKTRYYLNRKVDACYKAFILKAFGNKQ